MVRRITDRNSVIAAMDEFDRIGREAFLAKYSFGPALSYYLRRDGKRYDSKAIYGAAHRLQFPEDGEVTSLNFSGGAQAVKGPLEALGFDFEDSDNAAGDHAPTAQQISANDVLLIAASRHKGNYASLSTEEHAAYVHVTEALQFLGAQLLSRLSTPSKFELRLTSGFSIQSGVRGYIPKDLWFSVSPKANAKDLAGMPQLFMIVSERGIEYGFGASVSPSDFSQQSVKDSVRLAA